MNSIGTFLICAWVLFIVIIIIGFFINRSKELELKTNHLNLFPFKNFTKTYYVIFSITLLILLTIIVILSSLEYSESSEMFIS